MPEDLWPDDVATISLLEETPLSILREQARKLGEKTRNLVEADVETVAEGENLVHQFWVAAPALKYSRSIFHVRHADADPFPVRVVAYGMLEPPEQKLNDKSAFMQALRQVFASEKTQKLIKSLIAQSSV